MNNKIKKIIAREGLVVIGLILFGLVIVGINMMCNAIFVKINTGKPTPSFIPDNYTNYDIINRFGFIVTIFGYPIYLVVKFIIWAVKVLKQKS